MSFGVCVSPALVDVCIKIDGGICRGLHRVVRGVRRLPMEAIIDHRASAGAIAAICANALLGGIECIARVQRGTAWLSSLPCDCSGYGSGLCFSANSPRGNDSAGLAGNRCGR